MQTQDWTAGKAVKVGFMTLTVVRQAPEDREDRYLPIPWLLVSAKGIEYLFTPYNGLSRRGA